MGKEPLHILLLEDSRFDAELIATELKKLGQPVRLETIQSESELRRALDFQAPDIILSDHGLPSFDGFRALQIVRRERPELPFIFVSGSNNQQMVVEMHDLGATDYVFKRDLVDLCPTIQRALTQPAEVRPTDEFREPALEVSAPVQTQTSSSISPIGHLQFCPGCQQAWDETGKIVDMGRYLANYPEANIHRRVCAMCG